MGWCADPDIYYPFPVSKDEINVFIDHSPKAPDCTIEYYKAFKEIQQNNKGIIKCDFEGKGTLDSSLSFRSNKVPWIEIIETYKQKYFFCITHPESACLSAIEGAMCGGRLYILKYRWNRIFLYYDLIKEGIHHSIFRGNSNSIVSTFLWKLTDERIHKELSIL